MKSNYYIFSDTLIRKKDRSLLFETIDRKEFDSRNLMPAFEDAKEYKVKDKKLVPIESVNSIFSFGDLRFGTRLLNLLSIHEIPLHIFSLSGNYTGSFLPASEMCSGKIMLQQANCYNSFEERLYVAKQFIKAAVHNMLANMNYYNNRDVRIDDEIEFVENIEDTIDCTKDISELMGKEGTVRKTYYGTWDKIFTVETGFYRRVKNPPDNWINAMISYGNVLVYAICLNEIYRTRLRPEIGFLHEPGDNKLSLSYDIAEIFKPIITDRIIFKMVNKRIAYKNGFNQRGKACQMGERLKKIFVQEFDDKMATTIFDRKSERNMSYRRLVREECYKLVKHISGEEKYEALRMRW